VPNTTPVETTQPAPFTKDPEKLDRALAVHHELAQQLDAIAKQHGLDVVHGDASLPFDLGWKDEGAFWVVEIKSLNATNEVHQLRYGIGQLLEYRLRLEEHCHVVRSVLAVERPPSDPRWLKICRAAGIDLVWPATFASLFERRAS